MIHYVYGFMAGTTKKWTKNAGKSYIKKQIRFPLYVTTVVIGVVWWLFCCIVITQQATNYTLVTRGIKLLQFLENYWKLVDTPSLNSLLSQCPLQKLVNETAIFLLSVWIWMNTLINANSEYTFSSLYCVSSIFLSKSGSPSKLSSCPK
jgi:hypothetical protein